MNRIQKEEVVKNITEDIKDKDFVLTGFKGLTVSQISELRDSLRDANSEFKVIKNRLLNISFKELALDGFKDDLEGNTAIVVNRGDSLGSFKVLVDFAKSNEKLTLKKAKFGDSILESKEIKRIASLPSKEILIGKLVSQLQSPISKFVYTLKNPINKIVYILDAIKNNKK